MHRTVRRARKLPFLRKSWLRDVEPSSREHRKGFSNWWTTGYAVAKNSGDSDFAFVADIGKGNALGVGMKGIALERRCIALAAEARLEPRGCPPGGGGRCDDRAKALGIEVGPVANQEKIMVYRGRLKEGVIVLDDPSALPDGTEVTVRPLKNKLAEPAKNKPGPKVRQGIMKFAGQASGLSANASKNVDHYLYGHPKR